LSHGFEEAQQLNQQNKEVIEVVRPRQFCKLLVMVGLARAAEAERANKRRDAEERATDLAKLARLSSVLSVVEQIARSDRLTSF